MTELESIRSLRARQLLLTHLPKDQLKSLEIEFGRYLLVPLDTPNFGSDAFTQWFFEHAAPIAQMSRDIAGPAAAPKVDSIDVQYDNLADKHSVTGKNFNEEFKDMFPHFKEQIEEFLPIAKLRHVKFWSSFNMVGLHRDSSAVFDCPLGFRSIMHDSNPASTLYIRESVPDKDLLERVYFPYGIGTTSYVWNNLRVKHGSDFVEGHRKILMIVNRFDLDVERYKQIMRASVGKFGPFVTHSSFSAEDFR